jgi:TolB-like protein/DNA-binding winged helix-turn-helix (wHTH) protein
MTKQRISSFTFDDVCVDLRNFKVLKAGTNLPLEPKTLLLLTFLIENRDRLVEKRELLDVIWKDVAVTENALTREIGKLRKSLGDDPKKSRYIQTVHTRGYRFIAEVRVVDGETEPVTIEPALPPVSHPDRGLSKWTPRHVFGALGVLALLIAIAFVLSRPAESARMQPAKHGQTTLAILPFRSLGADAGDQDFGLGMADALITKLSNSAQLTVEPVSTVLHYADPKRDSLSIGRAMGVDYVLEGKFQRLGARVRVTVQLLCVSCNGKSQWAATFDEGSGDLFAVQDSISQKVMASLPLELTGDEQKKLAKRETSQPQAQIAFAKGRLYLNQDSKENLDKATDSLELAVSLDPSFAAAWAVLSDSYRRREWYGGSPADYLPSVRSAVARAAKLDDTEVYTHSMLGLVAFQYDWDFATAEREYVRAREIMPSFVHQWFARYLLTRGRTAEAEAEYTRFSRNAPFSVAGRANFAEFLFLTGQYPRALEQIQQTFKIRDTYAPAHELAGLVYEQQGLLDKATDEFREAIKLSNGLKGLASLGHLEAVAGRHRELDSVLQDLAAQKKQRYVGPFEMALVHAGMRDNARAIEDIEKAYADRSLAAQSLLFDPRLKELRNESKYRAFAKRIGLD